MDAATLTAEIRDQLLTKGFADVGTCPAIPPPGAAHLEDWIAAGLHGGLDYMARRPEERRDPSRYHAAARWMVVVAAAYPAEPLAIPDDAGAALRVAAYAARRDYHDVLRRRLHDVRLTLRGRLGIRGRVFVDSAPVMEKAVAVHAGLGRIGRNGCFIHPVHGSWVLLGGFTIDRDLVRLHPPGPVGDCGDCARCQDACPVAALRGPGILDARRCLSYWTVEHAGPLPRPVQAVIGRTGTLFGCDVCQAVCPDNRRRSTEEPGIPELGQHAPLAGLTAKDVEGIGEEDFRARFGDTPVARLGREGLLRNLAALRGEDRLPGPPGGDPE